MLPKLLLLKFCYLLAANSFAQFNPNLTYGEVKDVEGNKYKTIKIGTQTWMAENLRTTKYRDGSNIPVVSDSTDWADNWNNSTTLPMMCWYNNDSATYTANKIGALYNWYAINPATNGNKNVCPTGWHVPTNTDWNILIANLDPTFDSIYRPYSSIAGSQMKSTGTQYWLAPNANANNSSGFSGLPGGCRYEFGRFNDIGEAGYWWSSTEFGTNRVWIRSLSYNYGGVGIYFNLNKTYGLSVRCIKD